jgi:hypothetical protein
MHEQDKARTPRYPTGRGYGHDYMRGGEVFGGYGYADRPEYEQRRGEAGARDATPPSGAPPGGTRSA